MKTLQDKIDYLKKFAEDRNWEMTIGNTKALITSLFVESGELAEHFQWKDDEWIPETDKDKKSVMYEIVDVLNYLLRLAGMIEGISLDECWEEKMKKLEKKYPVDATHEEHKKSHDEYRQTGKNKLYED